MGGLEVTNQGKRVGKVLSRRYDRKLKKRFSTLVGMQGFHSGRGAGSSETSGKSGVKDGLVERASYLCTNVWENSRSCWIPNRGGQLSGRGPEKNERGKRPRIFPEKYSTGLQS